MYFKVHISFSLTSSLRNRVMLLYNIIKRYGMLLNVGCPYSWYNMLLLYANYFISPVSRKTESTLSEELGCVRKWLINNMLSILLGKIELWNKTDIDKNVHVV